VESSTPTANSYVQPQQFNNGYIPPYPYPPVYPNYPVYPYGNFANPYQASLLGQTSGLSGPIAKFDVKINGKSDIVTVQKGNTIDSMEITAQDANGKTVESFTGPVDLVSTDRSADMAQSVTFEANALGYKTLVLCCTFFTEGEQIVQVSYYDDATGAITEGQITVIVEDSQNTAGGKGSISITSHSDGEVIGATNIILKGNVTRDNGSPFKNGSFVARGFINDVPFSTGDDGEFVVAGEFDGATESQLVRIEAPDGNAVTTSIQLKLDLQSPKLANIAFLPKEPLVGQEVQLSFTSEPGLQNITATFGGETVNMKQRADLPGTYNGSFMPKVAGAFEIALQASDLIGNIGTETAEITISTPDLAVVEGLTLTPGDKKLIVNYDAHPDEVRVKRYQIYFGEEEDVYDKSFETEGLKTEFVLDNLIPGKTYYVTVTALSDELESARSTVVNGVPLGTALQAVPGPHRIDLAWLSSENLDQYLQLVINYGIAADALTETKVVANAQRAHQIIDLLPIEYFFTLSGQTEDGELTLLGSTNATPLAIAGVPTGVSEPIPNTGQITIDNPTTPGNNSGSNSSTPSTTPVQPEPKPTAPGQDNLHAAPGMADSGIDMMWWLYLLIALAVLPLALWRVSHITQQAKTTAFTKKMDEQYNQEHNIVRLG